MLNNKISLIYLVLLIASNILSANSYKGAEYRTKESFLYGRFEVRYKPAQREAVVSSFFTYHEIDNTSEWNEIDFEFIGRYANSVQFNTITPGQRFHIRTQHIDFNAYADFHDYAFEWTPEYVAWFIDGIEVYRQTGDHISKLIHESKIMMNIWNPIYTNWVGNFDDKTLPCAAVYDYVKYSSYSPGSGNYGTDNNFTLEWSDDFDAFDESRWEKASHTFPGNLATFYPENVLFKDGLMYLYLTSETEVAGVDNLSPAILYANANYDSTITIKLSEEVTKSSAENISNYTLPGGIVTSAILDESSLFVNLETQNYNPFSLNNLIYSGFVDLSENANTSTTSVRLINKVDSLSFPIKINIGGNEFNDYLPDQEWSNEVLYGYWMGDRRSIAPSIDILQTDEDEIFRSMRKGLITYKFRLPKGLYNLTFQFSDNYNNDPGESIFNIYAEKSFKQSSIDLIPLVGKNAAYEITTEVEIEDGILDIYFEEEIDSAFVNGIIVNKIITDVDRDENDKIDNSFSLGQNYPNPFNPATKIDYRISEKSSVQIGVFDILGNKIDQLINKLHAKGDYSINFNGSDYSSGIYYYSLIINGNLVETKKMALIK